jgi:hypothetical protein
MKNYYHSFSINYATLEGRTAASNVFFFPDPQFQIALQPENQGEKLTKKSNPRSGTFFYRTEGRADYPRKTLIRPLERFFPSCPWIAVPFSKETL